jgi:hypothetical protein
LAIPLDLLRSAIQRADATAPATNGVKEFDVGIFRLRRQVRVFHKSRYRRLGFTAGPVIVDPARIASKALELLFDELNQRAARKRVRLP